MKVFVPRQVSFKWLPVPACAGVVPQRAESWRRNVWVGSKLVSVDKWGQIQKIVLESSLNKENLHILQKLKLRAHGDFKSLTN